MLERFSRGWAITKASWSVLKLHPKLMLLPLASSLALFTLLALIGAGGYMGHKAGLFTQMLADDGQIPVGAYAILFAIYFVCSFVIVFFNAAMVFCSLQAFNGEEPSIGKGLATAAGRLPQILAWALLASTIGVLLSSLQEFLRDKLSIFGSLLGSLLEASWALVTYFVVPVLVVDGVGPIEAVKRSGAILKKTWGESLAGEGGMSAISFLLLFPVFLLVVAAMITFKATVPVVAWMVAAAAVPYAVAVVLVFTALGTIFRTGTYVYATTGKAPEAISADLVARAFRKK
jgi:hypothetical protein